MVDIEVYNRKKRSPVRAFTGYPKIKTYNSFVLHYINKKQDPIIYSKHFIKHTFKRNINNLRIFYSAGFMGIVFSSENKYKGAGISEGPSRGLVAHYNETDITSYGMGIGALALRTNGFTFFAHVELSTKRVRC
jgi:hypothetical protein